MFRKLYEHEYFIRPLFPNLQEVQLPVISDDPNSTIFYPALVLSPSVRRIVLSTPEWEEESEDEDFEDPEDYLWDAVANRVAGVASTLTSFKVESIAFSDCFVLIGRRLRVDHILRYFTWMMTTLELDGLVLEGKTFAQLNHLTGLVKLKVSLVSQQDAEMAALPPLSLCLPSLECLTINIFVDGPHSKFFQILDAKRLKRLKLKVFTDDEDDYDPTPLFISLHHHRRNSGLLLEEIHLTRRHNGNAMSWDEYVEQPHFVISEATFAPLLYFPRLTTLRIEPCNSSALDDLALVRLFTAWPKMQRFELHDESMKFDERISLTIGGVQRALQLTPYLRQLSLRFDGTFLPPCDEDVCLRLHPLETLNACTSIIEVGTLFAGWLVLHFPNLSQVRSFEKYREGLEDSFECGCEDEDERKRLEEY
ncbi:hypothetical protein CC1G_12312 [Coprinopsis cinerea okayama7|uniref:F-box domain-containing protein n=1 Tax=Coprinopsis cinerea (strain Okayama-7 / 130 / ATCC MYA-4618 / FGSC 9003) TaxID=240176 RepID=A8NLV6_COPC7|nr:hypothetical protein CC1G_12312 [Coprinopsis cinerea okayama7\|eukprot:XP_001834785.2 hypothetical protein CC1G_12312 [Coprinopsis cinerea okayama7\